MSNMLLFELVSFKGRHSDMYVPPKCTWFSTCANSPLPYLIYYGKKKFFTKIVHFSKESIQGFLGGSVVKESAS